MKREKRHLQKERSAEDLTRPVLPETKTAHSTKRSVQYKPVYDRTRGLTLAKRITGILLLCMLAFVLLSALFMWGIPAIQSALTKPPESTATPSATPENPDASPVAEALTSDPETGLPIYEDAFNLCVVNEKYVADSTFEPPLAQVDGISVHENLTAALTALQTAAKTAGIELSFASGYIAYDTQQTLYEKEVARRVASGDTKVMARKNAKRSVAAPGEADEQSGMCVTLAGTQEAFEASETPAWLLKHMNRYGFVERFPKGSERYTGREGTGLVLRYVGAENAAAMRRLSMCLEEYIGYIG